MGCKCPQIDWIGVRKKIDDINKVRVYIRDPSEAPEGAIVRRGPRGGLYYETEDVLDADAEFEGVKLNDAVRDELKVTREKYAQAVRIYRLHRKWADDIYKFVNRKFGGRLRIGFRVRTVHSLLKELARRQYADVGKINDVISIKILAGDLDSLYDTAEKLKDLFGKAIVGEHDYIKKSIGYYRAYILNVHIRGLRIEIILMTKELNMINVVGHARQQRLKAIEDRLEKFYIPLIKAFSSYVYTAQTEDEIETIITCRRYLAGNNLLRVLPMHFKFKADKIAGSANWTFYAKEDFEQWKEALDVLWEEFLEVLKEYYTLSGTEISLPEKPDWLIGYK
ncbi:hypothetical protein AFULGI_00010100 [Archaeoglobus fulgidus DSM 8774]|uniref:Uncharacterized protein AF-0924 domain-containing protein n=2 Tax=Archaeoglobus fulgidus TaxID=2234 RepID=A0A075WBI9_ARCFL|nr:hypothetical protein AFULGI_00010100 [Archaeoglobus fulgidus DSM 8774]